MAPEAPTSLAPLKHKIPLPSDSKFLVSLRTSSIFSRSHSSVVDNLTIVCHHGILAQLCPYCHYCPMMQADSYTPPRSMFNPPTQDGYGLNSSLNDALQFQTGPTQVG